MPQYTEPPEHKNVPYNGHCHHISPPTVDLHQQYKKPYFGYLFRPVIELLFIHKIIRCFIFGQSFT